MAVDYRTIAHEGYSEITEKKSRFLGEAVRAATLKEAEEYIAAVRKRHYDARHHCFAFCVGEPGTPDEIWRSSDDGEPSGTAGRPMLDVLTGEGITNVLAIVTRYFGGVLLGTGGLVRAYSGAVRSALENSIVLERTPGILIKVRTDYSGYGRIRYQLDTGGIPVTDTSFTDNVEVSFICTQPQLEGVNKMLMETTGGAAGILEKKDIFFGMDGDSAIIL